MKYVAILFSFYLTLLAVLPCRDSDDFGDLVKTHTVVTKSHSADEKAGKETCTPFCTCACCSTVRTITPYHPVIGIFMQEVQQTFGEPDVPALLTQSVSVWQPPQIA
ncbi:DUF6660 family protein [Mucilaginibacter defluvii]|jgi:hypothetical protein|uniref:DUF6660 family protein n=1 Tax=Mucilaginibacter defluvii TaxID=1196019 RepID=UPI0031EABABD